MKSKLRFPELLTSGFDQTGQSTWLILFIVVLLSNAPYFSHRFFPQHDAMLFLQVFKYYYSELFYNRQIPLWVPDTGFGTPFDYPRDFGLGPFQYVSMAAGLLLRIRDVKTVFIFSLCLDIYFCGLSMYLLAREAGARSIAALAVSVMLVTGLIPDTQLDFNYKIVTSLPLSMYLALRFVRTMDLRFAAASFAILVIFTFGMAPYLLVIQFYLVVTWSLVLATLLAARGELDLTALRTRILSSLIHPVTLAASVVILLAFAALWHEHTLTNAEMQLLAADRNSQNYAVPLQVFLTYGGNINTGKIIEAIVGLPTAHSLRFFFGIIIPMLVVYAAIRQRTPIVWASLITAVLAFLFTMPAVAPIARLAYYLPGMSLVRHIGYFAEITKPVMGFLAALGLTSLFALDDTRARPTAMVCLRGMLAVSLATAGLVAANLWSHTYQSPAVLVSVLVGVAAICGAFVWPLVAALLRGRWSALIMIAGSITIVVAYACALTNIGKQPLFYKPYLWAFPWIWIASFAPAFIAWVVMLGRRTERAPMALILIAAGLMEVCGYRAFILTGSPGFTPHSEAANASVMGEPLKWRAMRRYNAEQPIWGKVFGHYRDSALYGFASTYLDIDSCDWVRQDLLVRGVADLRLARETGRMPRPQEDFSRYLFKYLTDGDEAFTRAVGCHAPKLQFAIDPTYAATDTEAAALIHGARSVSPSLANRVTNHSDQLPRIDQFPVIEAPALPSSTTIPSQDAHATVIKFSPDHLFIDVDNRLGRDAWLIYLDAFTPRWQATVDGVRVPIHKANLAFKAVLVPKGPHRISFFLEDLLTQRLALATAVLLGFSGAGALSLCIRDIALRNRRRHPGEKAVEDWPVLPEESGKARLN